MISPYQHCSACGSDSLDQQGDREFVCTDCGFRHFITSIPAACALILDSQNRLLVLRRAHAPGDGMLGLPGGVIEPDETGEEAAARETQEEAGINIPVSEFKYLASLPNRYLFQDYLWPTIDLFYTVRVQEFGELALDPKEVSEALFQPLAEVQLEDFAFHSNAEAVRRLQERLAKPGCLQISS